MRVEPLKHKSQCTLREIVMHDTALDIERDLVLSVHGMEMRRRILPREDYVCDFIESSMNRLCYQPHSQRPTDFSDSVIARLRIGSECLVQGFAG